MSFTQDEMMAVDATRRLVNGTVCCDRHGNLNSTVIGSYDNPKVRLPGAGGAPEIATSVRDVFVMVRQIPRAFVERVDFVSSVGSRVRLVVTDLGILEPQEGKLALTRVHLGVKIDDVRAARGWEPRVADEVGEMEPPSGEELVALSELKAG